MGEALKQRRVGLDPDHVGDPEGAKAGTVRRQRLYQGPLGTLGQLPEVLVNIGRLLELGGQQRGRTQVGLLGQDEQELDRHRRRGGQELGVDLGLPGVIGR